MTDKNPIRFQNLDRRIRNSVMLITLFVSTMMHYPHMDKDLMSVHVWRQTQTQSTAINFYEEDMNILNPRRNDRGAGEGIFRMEFPIMQWLVALLYKIFGNHLIITRIFMLLIGFCTLLGLYTMLEALFGKPMLSALGTWAFNFSPAFFYYTINPLPDNLALSAGIWGLASFFTWYNRPRSRYLFLSSFLMALAALCKLPFLFYFIVPMVFFIPKIIRNGIKTKYIHQGLLAGSCALLPIAWYVWVIPQWDDNPILTGVLENQETFYQLIDYYQHNLISILPELLVGYGALLFFLSGFYYLYKNRAYSSPKFSLLLALSGCALAYYFFEANAIAKVHDYYLFPFYPMIFILVAYGAYNFYKKGGKFQRYFTLLLLVLIPVTCALRMQGRWDPQNPSFNKDLLTYKTDLRNAVPKDALVIAGNDLSHFIMFYYIDKKGWGIDDCHLSPSKFRQVIDMGAQYLYSDSRDLDSNIYLRPYLEKLILQRGSVKVFKLKDAADIASSID